MNFLTPEELAELLKLEDRRAALALSRRPGFPASVTGRKKPRWLEDDVKRWARSAQNAHKAREPA